MLPPLREIRESLDMKIITGFCASFPASVDLTALAEGQTAQPLLSAYHLELPLEDRSDRQDSGPHDSCSKPGECSVSLNQLRSVPLVHSENLSRGGDGSPQGNAAREFRPPPVVQTSQSST
jgi:hypothetical protein